MPDRALWPSSWLAPTTGLFGSRYRGNADKIFGGPHRGQSMRGLTNRCRIGSGAANGSPYRTGRYPEIARAHIVTWPIDAVGHVVDTTPKAPC
jgi:hypothetical protein